MKKFIVCFIMAICSLMMTSCFTKSDPAADTMRVKLIGSNRGVEDVTLETGWIIYNPIVEEIFKYPNFVQTIDYDTFSLNSKDGSKFIVDPTLILQLEEGKGPLVFKTYRKPLDEILNKTFYKYVQDVYRIELNKYTADELISNRNKFETDVQSHLDSIMRNEHFYLKNVTSGLKYPPSLEQAIDMKNKVVQDELRAQNEVRLAEAQAKKLIVQAEAEKQANELKTKALTPAILEQMWIEKWDGKLPVYGQVPTLFKDITK
jgi:regulator of protease activity HflC (stomatin/prohibitin superfamily)